jgi:DNA-binding MarR family transcriptional regulator
VKPVKLPPEVIASSVAHQLRRASQASTGAWQDLDPGMTLPQHSVLCVLAANEGQIDQAALGYATSIDKATLVSMLDRLEKRSLITRDVNPHNRRERLITITADGRDHMETTNDLAAAHEQWFCDVLGEKQVRQLADILRTLGDRSHHANRSVDRSKGVSAKTSPTSRGSAQTKGGD